jgi:LPXTG-motif cell wall-anchored protein
MAGAKFKLYAGDAPASLEGFEGTALKLKAAAAEDGAYSADKDVYIKDAEGSVEEVTTTTKELCFAGLDAGKYFLVETEAPAGYAKLGTAIPFEVVALKADDTNAADGEQTGKSKVIVANDGYIELQKADKSASDGIMPADGTTGDVNMVIKNYEGVTLPGTGSITSLILMGAGAAVAIGGGLFFGLKKKKDDEDEDA